MPVTGGPAIETSEAEPLLTCLRLDPSERKLAQLRSLTAAGWGEAAEQARRYGLAPALYWSVKDLPVDTNAPGVVRQELRSSFVNSAGKNLLLYRDLAAILEALQPAGIPVALLKGLHLARWVYPEMALRSMADLDLLLRREDLARAEQVLGGLGYRPVREYDLGRVTRQHQHIPPLYQPGKAPVELHWHIATPGSPLRIDLDGLWARSQLLEVDGAPARVLSLEDLLLHLSLHLLQDEFIAGLRRVYDFAALALYCGGRLDWDKASTRATAWGCHKSLFLALHLARSLFGAPVPDEALQRLRPADFSPQIEALALERVFGERPAELHPDLARLRRNRPLRSKTAALLGALFPYPEYVAAKYDLPPGSKKVYFYYLVRLKDLARRYGWQLWRVARSDEAAAALAQRENALSDWWMTG